MDATWGLVEGIKQRRNRSSTYWPAVRRLRFIGEIVDKKNTRSIIDIKVTAAINSKGTVLTLSSQLSYTQVRGSIYYNWDCSCNYHTTDVRTISQPASKVAAVLLIIRSTGTDFNMVHTI